MKIKIQDKHRRCLSYAENGIYVQAVTSQKTIRKTTVYGQSRIRRNDALTIEFSNQGMSESSVGSGKQLAHMDAQIPTEAFVTSRVIAGLCTKSRRKTLHVQSRYNHIKVTYIIEKAMPTLTAITPTKEWYSKFKDIHINRR